MYVRTSLRRRYTYIYIYNIGKMRTNYLGNRMYNVAGDLVGKRKR